MKRPYLAFLTVALVVVATPGAGLAQGTVQLRVTPERIRLRVGERAAVVVTPVAPEGAAIPALVLVWSSTDTTIVQVEADAESPDVGRLVAQGAGSAVVEVRSGGSRGFVTVQVQAAPPPPAPALAPPPAPAAAAPSQPTRAPRAINLTGIARNNNGALALVTMYAANEVYDGTGFVISRGGYLVTTRSVVARLGQNPDSMVVRMANQQSAKRADVLTVSSQVEIDLAILRIRDYQGPSVQKIDWTGNHARTGDPAAVMGFPGGASRAVDETGTPRTSMYGGVFTQVNAERLMYDAQTSPGSGGSPVFNADGEVVGVHRARMSDGSAGVAVHLRDLVRMLPPGLREELGL
jgi:S1-C subfamily serine protease